MREKQDLGVEIAHGWFTHGGDSIRSAFFGEPCERTNKGSNEFLGQS